jgi:hypothetical protein
VGLPTGGRGVMPVECDCSYKAMQASGECADTIQPLADRAIPWLRWGGERGICHSRGGGFRRSVENSLELWICFRATRTTWWAGVAVEESRCGGGENRFTRMWKDGMIQGVYDRCNKWYIIKLLTYAFILLKLLNVRSIFLIFLLIGCLDSMFLIHSATLY